MKQSLLIIVIATVLCLSACGTEENVKHDDQYDKFSPLYVDKDNNVNNKPNKIEDNLSGVITGDNNNSEEYIPNVDEEHRVDEFYFAGKYNEIIKKAINETLKKSDDFMYDTLKVRDELGCDPISYVLEQAAMDYEYTDVKIHMKPTLNEDTGVIECIVQFRYDYWIIFYVEEDGYAIGYQDTTGYFSEIYTPRGEEVEWD